MVQIHEAGLGIFGLKKVIFGLLIFGLVLGLGGVASAAAIYTPEDGTWQKSTYNPLSNAWSWQTAWSDATPYGSQSYLDTSPDSEDLMWNQEESHAELTQAEKSRISSQMAKLHIPFIVN